jgi:hypothetical protein
LEENIAAAAYKSENTAAGIRHADHVARSIRKKLALTSCSVGIVRSRTQATEFLLTLFSSLSRCTYHFHRIRLPLLESKYSWPGYFLATEQQKESNPLAAYVPLISTFERPRPRGEALEGRLWVIPYPKSKPSCIWRIGSR